MKRRFVKILACIFVFCTAFLCFGALACDGCGKSNNTYYLFEDSEYVQEDYLQILSGDNWSSSLNGNGKYVKADNTYTFNDAEGAAVMSGSISGDKITMSDGRVYRIKGDKDDNGNKYTGEAELTRLAAATVNQQDKTVSFDMPKGTSSFNFASNATVSATATWKLYANNGQLIKSKIADNLTNGDNIFKIKVKSGDWTLQVEYTITIHVIYSVQINYVSDGVTYRTVTVDTHTRLDKGPDIANKTGYKFGGWGSEGWFVTGPKSFNANWIGVNYSVHYDGNGANSGTMANSAHVYGTDSKLSVNKFGKTGYYFAGWATSSDGEVVYEDEQIVKTLCATEGGTVNLFAYWTSSRYTVVYNKVAADATGDTPSTLHNYGVSKALSTNGFSYDGHHFMGWATTAGGSVVYGNGQSVLNLTAEDGATVNLYAVWQINTYTVHFSGNGAQSGKVNDQTWTYGETHIAPTSDYARIGYTYAGGWSTAQSGAVMFAEGGTVTDLTVENNVQVYLYACWEPITYTVRYNANGGSGEMQNDTFTYDVQKALTANAFTNTGFHFAGWTVTSTSTIPEYENGQTVKNLSASSGDVIDLYAIWVTNVYYVTYNKNDSYATGEMQTSTFYYGVEKALTANAFTKTGYHFAGWATSSGGTAVYADKQILTTAVTQDEGILNLYAVWVVNTYTVSYDGNGYTDGSTTASTHTYGVSKDLTANGYTRTGYKFMGWAETSTGDVVYGNSQSVINLTTENGKQITIYAVWQANTYTVTYNGNGATSGSMSATPHVYGVSQALAANQYSRTGYRFGYWKAPGGAEYADGANVVNLTATDNGSVELTAIWLKNVTGISVTNSDAIIAPTEAFAVRYAFGTDEVSVNKVSITLISAPAGTTVDNNNCTLTVSALTGGTVTLKLVLIEPYGTIESAEYTLTVAKGITNATDLYNVINSDLGGDYVITESFSIDASTWTPIGTESNPFTGTVTSGDNIITIYVSGSSVPLIIAYCSDDAVVEITTRIKKNA